MPAFKKKKNSSVSRSRQNRVVSWIRYTPTSKLTAIAFALAFVALGGYIVFNSSHAASPELRSGVGGNLSADTPGPYCLDDKGDGGVGSQVDLWQCNGSAAQHYSFSGGLIHIGAGCARVDGTSASSPLGNRNVVIGVCSPVPWGAYWTKAGGQFHNDRADTTGTTYCLDVSGAAVQHPVIIYPCKDTSNNANERWYPDTYGDTTGGGGTTSNPYRNPFHGASVQNERIDQGVDFGGTATVYAIGDGTITNSVCGSASGWEGGCFIEERLSQGKAAGKYVYVAEDCTSYVHSGQAVTTNTAICKMYNGGHGIETGWSAHVGTLAMAHSEYYEGLATSFGQNYSQLLHSIGAPYGNISQSSAISHKALPVGWPTW